MALCGVLVHRAQFVVRDHAVWVVDLPLLGFGLDGAVAVIAMPPPERSGRALLLLAVYTASTFHSRRTAR